LRLDWTIPENGDITAARNLYNQSLVRTLAFKISFDPLAELAYVGANDIVIAGVVVTASTKHLHTNSLFVNGVEAILERALSEVKEKFLQPGGALHMRAGGDSLQ
jgi:hypothetical protein